MKLLTAEITRKLEQTPLYSQENNENPEIIVKFFTPDSSWTWYVTEGRFEEGTWLFFGLTDTGREQELGYFTLAQLEEVRGQFKLPVERDMHFNGKKLNDVRKA
jgi:hypothetical protein